MKTLIDKNNKVKNVQHCRTESKKIHGPSRKVSLAYAILQESLAILQK